MTAPPILPRFGVEVEFADGLDAEEVADALTDAGLACRSEDYNHSVRDFWKVVPDSSCGLELVSPPLFWHQRLDVRRAITVLRDLGAEVNVDCGFHVHHEWPWWDHLSTADYSSRLLRLRHMYRANRPLLLRLLSPSRWDGNRFCRWDDTGREGYCPHCATHRTGSCSRHPLAIETAGLLADRYVAVNMTALPRQGTVEFRQHQGTLNHTKALAWIELTRTWVHAASRPDLSPEERADYAYDKITTSTWNYLRSRCPNELEDIIAACKTNMATDLSEAA